ncbi:MAG: PQQ-binding-like beta-propeller repeat protein [Phycisphaerae bacterium]|nr:PQQ-binding-like beta-propeller repeat protein [Phycisphaerae bacterium]
MKRTWLLALVLACAGGWPVVATGQPGDPMPAAEDDAPPLGGVYVPDSGEARQRIRQAQRLADGKMWDQAALMLQDVYTRYGTRLLMEGAGAFVSVAERVNRTLADWPAEGLAVYRNRYDGVAKRAYEGALASGSAIEMASVARQYWASSIGARAADEAAEMSLESGRFSAAIDLWSRLIAQPPRLADNSFKLAPIMAKLAVAYSWNSQPLEAKKIRDRLGKEFPDWRNEFGGSGGTLLAWSERYTQSLAAANTSANPAGDYPIFGGASDRNGIAPGQLNFGAEMWFFDRHKVSGNQPQPNPQMYGYPQPTGVKKGRLANLLSPVIANNVLYLSSPMGVFALSAANGKTPLWHNPDFKMGGTANPNYGYQPQAALLYSPTYYEGRLYLEYGVSYARNYYGGAQTPGGGLVCLDALNGKLVWKLELDSIPSLRGGLVDGSPLAFGGRVYMVVHVARSVFDSVVVVAADARTGRVVWQQAISEADSGGGYQFIRSQAALPAAEGNTIYFGTNMGTVAAVSAETGLVRWLRQYDRINRAGNGPMFQPVMLAPATNEFAPTIVWNGRVVVSPTDCEDMLVLEAQTGKVLAKLNKKNKLYDVAELYGVVDGKLIGRGSQVFAWDLLKNEEAWHITPDAEPTYRGLVTQQYLYLPSKNFLLRMDLAKGGATEKYRFKDGQDGTVLLTNQQIITVNPSRMAGFCEWEEAERLAKEAIAKATPERKPDEILNYVQYSYATRHFVLAQEQLNRAVEEAGGFASLTREDFKLRVFISALDIAGETWTLDPKATRELLTVASLACPGNAESHVRYRIVFGKYWDDNNDRPQAVKYYQEVLNDPTMRAASYLVDEQTKHEAGRYARDRIDRLIEKHGAEVYAAVAAQADRDYAAALEKNDWAEVDRLIYQYPNALRTRSEIYRMAEHLASEKDYDAAIGWLRFFRREYQSLLAPADDAKALMTMANYALDLRKKWQGDTATEEKMRLSQARRALRLAFQFVNSGRKIADLKVTIAGVEGTFADHRERMQKENGKQLQMLPQVSAGLKAPKEIVLGANARALRPQVGAGPATNDDITLITVMAPNGAAWDLRGYRLGKSTEPLWTRKYDAQRGGNTNLVTYFEEAAIISQLNSLKSINPETGDVLWTAELAEDRNMGGARFFSVHENLLLACGMMNAMVVDMETGKILSQFQLPDQAIGPPDLGEKYISFIARNRMQKVMAIDWRTGKRAMEADLASPDVLWSTVAADGRVIVSGGQTVIAGNEAATGRRLWEKRIVNQVYNQASAALTRGDAIYTGERAATQWHVVMRDALTGKTVWDRTLPSSSRMITGQPIRMYLQDDELIVWCDTSVAVLDAETGEVSYMPFLGQTDMVRDVLITQDYLVVVTSQNPNVAARAGRPQLQVEVRLYDRTSGGGVLEQRIQLSMEGYGQPIAAPASPGLAVQNSGMQKLYVCQPAEATPKK